MTTTETQPEQRSAEWYEQRKHRVTASVAGAILGVAPYMTRADVMRMMVRDFHGAEREFEGNIATMHGQAHEAGALFDFQMKTGLKVDPCVFFTYEDWLGASPDGLIGDDCVIEIKCPFGKRKDVEPAFKPIADQPHYFAQVQIQMHVTGRNLAYFYQWAKNGDDRELVNYDPAWIAENLPILAQFYAEYIYDREHDFERHIEAKRVEIDTPEAHKMAAEYDELAEQIERATERKKDLLADMVAKAGGKNAIFAGRKLTQTEKAGAISYAKAIAKYAPNADLEPFRGKPSSFWQLR